MSSEPKLINVIVRPCTFAVLWILCIGWHQRQALPRPNGRAQLSVVVVDPWVDLCNAIEVRISHESKYRAMSRHISKSDRKFLDVSDSDTWSLTIVAKKSRFKEARKKMINIASKFGYDLSFVDGTWFRCKRYPIK